MFNCTVELLSFHRSPNHGCAFVSITGTPLVINSDYEMPADGSLTIISTQSVISNDGAVTVTAWDIDLVGSLSAGTASMLLHGSQVDQTVGIGDMADMSVNNSEACSLVANGGLTVGSSSSGDISIGGLTDDCTDSLGRVVLIATKPTKIVKFGEGAPSSFNKGITVQSNGVVLNGDLSTKASQTILSLSTGTLTITASSMLSTKSQELSITVADTDIGVGAGLNSSAALTSITCSVPGSSIGLGNVSCLRFLASKTRAEMII